MVRTGSEKDYDHLVRVFNASRASSGCFGGGSITPNEFEEQVKGEVIHVMDVKRGIAGFVSVWERDKFVHHLYVAPRFQGQGIGKDLLDLCVEKYGLPLSLKCELANVRARRFYERHGWKAGDRGEGPNGPWQRLWLTQI